MSRVTELIFWINKDLVTYNIRKVNDPEIVSAINKGIEKICSLQNVVEGEIPVTLVTGTTVYALPAYFKKATGKEPITLQDLLRDKNRTVSVKFVPERQGDMARSIEVGG